MIRLYIAAGMVKQQLIDHAQNNNIANWWQCPHATVVGVIACTLERERVNPEFLRGIISQMIKESGGMPLPIAA